MRYTPTDERIPYELQKLNQRTADLASPAGTETERALLGLQEQINEVLVARSATTVQPGLIDVSATTPGVFPSFTRSFTVPPPEGGARVAQLGLSAEVARTSASGNLSLWVELLQNGAVTWRRTGSLLIGDGLSAPPGWASTQYINETVQIEVAGAAQANMALRFYTHTFVAETVTARISNITATLQYGARL